MSGLSRRKFLTYSLASLGSISLIGLGAWHCANEHEVVVSILKRRLSPLNIEETDYITFAKEYVEIKLQYKKQLKILSTFSTLYEYVTPYNLLTMGHPLQRLEDNIITKFLLSTDFFNHNADKGRKIKYLGFYDPYKQPCRQFFA